MPPVFFPDCLLIFGEKNGLFQFFLIYVFVKESVFYTGRKKIEQNFFQFGCINGTAICRKTNKKSGSDAFGCDFTCGSGKDFLSTVADGNQTAFTRTFCTEGIVVYLLFKLARQMVGKGDTCEIVFAAVISNPSEETVRLAEEDAEKHGFLKKPAKKATTKK